MQNRTNILLLTFRLMVILLLASPVFSQKALKFDLMTNPLDLSNKSPNICIQLQGNKYLNKLGLCGGFKFQAIRVEYNTRLLDALTTGFQAEIRLYPFAVANQRAEKEGCYRFGLSAKKKVSSLTTWLEGLYVAPGYAQAKTVFAIYPTGSTTIESDLYAASVRLKSLSAYLGYFFRIKFISLDIAYGFQIGKPIINDPWNLVDPSALSISYPEQYRFSHGLRLHAGINF